MTLPIYLRALLATLFAVLFLAGCASGPEVKSISKAPDVSNAPRNLLVLAISAKENNRKQMESALVSRLRAEGFQAEPYGPAPSLPWEDSDALRERVKERLQAQTADGVLTVSLVRKNRQIEYVPNQVVFNPVTTNIGALASVTYMETMTIPDRYEESTEYILRTTLFDTDSGKAIWQMFSSTVDPKSLEQAAREFARVAVRELQKSFTE
ncbi:MAG: YajG family lipoprotein [Marinobacter adhaerens]